eukprot:6807098-Heterocapsa_arctica.AAC.1
MLGAASSCGMILRRSLISTPPRPSPSASRPIPGLRGWMPSASSPTARSALPSLAATRAGLKAGPL